MLKHCMAYVNQLLNGRHNKRIGEELHGVRHHISLASKEQYVIEGMPDLLEKRLAPANFMMSGNMAAIC